MPCAVCAWREHALEVGRRFSKEEIDAPDFPAFPTATGGVPSKSGVLETIEGIAGKMGLPIVNDQGRKIYGVHSLRVSGAVHLTEIGIEIFLLRILFRWRSELVLRYAGEAPLGRLIEKYLEGSRSRTLEEVQGSIMSSVKDLVQQLIPRSPNSPSSRSPWTRSRRWWLTCRGRRKWIPFKPGHASP